MIKGFDPMKQLSLFESERPERMETAAEFKVMQTNSIRCDVKDCAIGADVIVDSKSFCMKPKADYSAITMSIITVKRRC